MITTFDSPEWFVHVSQMLKSVLIGMGDPGNSFLNHSEHPVKWITNEQIKNITNPEDTTNPLPRNLKQEEDIQNIYRQNAKELVLRLQNPMEQGQVYGSIVGFLLLIFSAGRPNDAFASGYDNWWDKVVEYVQTFNRAHNEGFCLTNFYDSCEAGPKHLYEQLVQILSKI
jgi:hypothetical protein